MANGPGVVTWPLDRDPAEAASAALIWPLLAVDSVPSSDSPFPVNRTSGVSTPYAWKAHARPLFKRARRI